MPEKKQTKQIGTENPEKLRGKETQEEQKKGTAIWLTGIAVLGVVYGDIGTSPLYALQKCFVGPNGVSAQPEIILGLLSLIFWSLALIIAVKYIAYVMRASNESEGGILALMALAEPAHPKDRSKRKWVIFLGIFGAALLYGDGMITPAISVLSAVEGLKVIDPGFEQYIIPAALVILVLLFLFQRQGTARVGGFFGPIMVAWFSVLTASGIVGILKDLSVLKALNPIYAIHFLPHAGFNGFLVLGAVFLVVTGGEALYADIGHFGKKPIRLFWFLLVMPALVTNYFGQGALLLQNPNLAGEQIFYHLLPNWTLYPMVVLATMATIIASQAIISASFSLTRQAVLLGYLPTLSMVQTSDDQSGQVYIAGVNWILMIATIGLVLGFQKSVNLAGAYGIAVSTTMVITTILMYLVAREKWQWPLVPTLMITVFFLAIDLLFMGSNLFKIVEGGYFPIVVAGIVFMLMIIWRVGNAHMHPVGGKKNKSTKSFIKRVNEIDPERVQGTAVFLTEDMEQVSLLMMRQLEFFKVLNEKVILLMPEIVDEPNVSFDQQVEVKELGDGICGMTIRYGFMENINIPSILKDVEIFDNPVNLDQVIYYVEYPRIVYGGKRGRKKLIANVFSFMARNAANPVEFFKIPYDQVMEVGVRVHLK